MHTLVKDNTFAKIVNNVHSAVLILDSEKQVLYANSSVGNVFNIELDIDFKPKVKSCILMNCKNRELVCCPGCKLNSAILEIYNTDKEKSIKGEYEFINSKNESKCFEFSAISLDFNDDKLVFVALNDVSENRQLAKLLTKKNEELNEKYKQLESQHLKLNELTNSLENSESILLAIANSIEAKDKVTNGHIQRVADYAQKIGEYFSLSKDELVILRKGAILHDIGKIGTPDHILNKPGKLTEEEFEIMKEHAQTGAKILDPLRSFEQVKKMVKHHHEKLDGSGYPDGLKGDEIDLHTRIIAVVDIYDAISAKRPYREALSSDIALKILDEDVSKNKLDGKVVEALKHILKR